jgi:hypothetical protein
MTWNDSCARTGVASNCASAVSDTPTGIDLVAGSGGASNCVNSTGAMPNVTCAGGYPKPAWQTGRGVPSDNSRDLPDVSLFAGDGRNNSFYVVCEWDAIPGEPVCSQGYSAWYFLGAGGTSASTPVFAGIMALVNQKAGERQGNANYVLYPLAAKSGASCTSNAAAVSNSSCIFYDVVTGNNSVACAGGSPNCSNTTSGGYGILEVNPPTNPSPAWSTSAGYDLATGLGSVNAANLVNKWTSVSFQPTTTTLASLSPTTLTHGQSVNFTINVASGSGSGTPTGNVSLIAQTGGSPSNVTGIGPFTLSGGSVTNSTNMLPGGSYGVTAHYAGDGTFGASDSTPPVLVTVNPEGSQTRVALLTFDPVTGQETSSNATSFQYGSSYTLLRVDVSNSSGRSCSSSSYPCPTGQVTLTDNGQQLDLPSYALNSEGYTEDQTTLFRAESNSIVAAYSGDNSYQSSTSPADVITMTPAPTTTTLTGLPSTAVANMCCEFTVNVATQSRGLAPSSLVEIQYGNTTVTPGGDYTGVNGSPTAFASVQAALGWTISQAGPTTFTALYPGDNRYAASASAPVTVTLSDFSVSASPSTVSISAPGQSGSTTLTLTPLYGFTGTVNLSCGAYGPGISCWISPTSVSINSSSSTTATITITTTAQPSAALPTAHRRIPTGLRLPAGWHWLLSALLALAVMLTLATARWRAAGWLFATALLVAGILVACGGGGGGGGSNPPPPAPIVTLSPATLTFGQENTGTTSPPQTVTLSNVGNASLSISNIAIGGTNSGDFAQTNNCGSSVAAGANCTISVTFTPAAVGSRSASLTITDNASDSPQTVSLTGTGAQLPVVSLSPTSLAFGQVDVSSTATQSVTLSNLGEGPLSISSITIYSPCGGCFAQTNNCGSSLVAGSNCTIGVTFSPWLTGQFSGSLQIVDNASDSPQKVNLTGAGIQPTPPGTYTISATGSYSMDRHSVNITVNVE